MNGEVRLACPPGSVLLSQAACCDYEFWEGNSCLGIPVEAQPREAQIAFC